MLIKLAKGITGYRYADELQTPENNKHNRNGNKGEHGNYSFVSHSE
jgi:hypothetical protein